MYKLSFHVEGVDLFDNPDADAVIQSLDHAALVTMEQGDQTISIMVDDDDVDAVLVATQLRLEQDLPNARVVKVAKTPISD